MKGKQKNNYPSLFDSVQSPKIETESKNYLNEGKIIAMPNYEALKLKSIENEFRSLSYKWL